MSFVCFIAFRSFFSLSILPSTFPFGSVLFCFFALHNFFYFSFDVFFFSLWLLLFCVVSHSRCVFEKKENVERVSTTQNRRKYKAKCEKTFFFSDFFCSCSPFIFYNILQAFWYSLWNVFQSFNVHCRWFNVCFHSFCVTWNEEKLFW